MTKFTKKAKRIDQNIDPSNLSRTQRMGTYNEGEVDNRTNRTKQRGISDNSGFGNTFKEVPIPTLILGGAEHVYPSLDGQKVNAQIVIGRDRPASLFSGYGAVGHDKCSTIDLVAGRISSFATTTTVDKNGEEKTTYADPSFQYDAARIYISEKTNIDKNFKLNPTSNLDEPVGSCSAVGIKADVVRIIGNEGIRLVTNVYPTNSRGGKTARSGIELVALNPSEPSKKPFDVQPFAKGDNLLEFLEEVTGHILSVLDKLEEFIEEQRKINKLVSNHTHPHAGTMTPTLFPGSPDVKNPASWGFRSDIDVFEANYSVAEEKISNITGEMGSIRKNIKTDLLTYIEDINSKDHILSKYNGTN